VVLAIIKDTADLPEWFSRENYAAAESFKAAEWYEQLNRRRELLSVFDYQLDRTKLMNDDGTPMYEFNLWRLLWARSQLDSIRQFPVGTPGGQAAWEFEPPIKNVKTFDLMKQVDRDAIALKAGLCCEEKLRRWTVIADPEAYYGPNEAISKMPIAMEYYGENRRPAAVIQVDLGATNGVLKKAFYAWLQQVRAEERETRSEDKGDKNNTLYQNWARYGLLPYLDLKMWMMETGNQIPVQVLLTGLARYPISESNFAKSAISTANRLMEDLTQLKSLAAIEA
jgi:hypothetical protein